jgi:hypothetical protein
MQPRCGAKAASLTAQQARCALALLKTGVFNAVVRVERRWLGILCMGKDVPSHLGSQCQ